MPDQMKMDFEGALNVAMAQMVQAAERGMGQAGMQLLRDANMEEPTVPHKEGTLAGSGSVFVQNNLIHAGTTTPATDHGEQLKDGQLVAIVGFNTPYAAYQHEGMRQDGSHVVKSYTPGRGAGPKFLEKKLLENKELYMKIVAKAIEKAGK